MRRRVLGDMCIGKLQLDLFLPPAAYHLAITRFDQRLTATGGGCNIQA